MRRYPLSKDKNAKLMCFITKTEMRYLIKCFFYMKNIMQKKHSVYVESCKMELARVVRREYMRIQLI